MILIAGTAADANRADDPSLHLQRDAAGKNHDLAVVRNMNAEELAARLRMLCQFLRLNVKCPRRVSLLHRDINTANPGVIHTNVRYDVSAFVSHCDVHGLADFRGFLLRRADYAAGIRSGPVRDVLIVGRGERRQTPSVEGASSNFSAVMGSPCMCCPAALHRGTDLT